MQARADDEPTPLTANERPQQALALQATLRRRAKLIRGLLLVATIGLPLILLLRTVQASAASDRHATHGYSPPLLSRDRAPAPWLTSRSVTGPVPGTLDIQPASMDGDVVYACWVDSPSGSGLHQPAPLHLAVSGDGASTWRALSSPLPRATACRLVPDASDARRITLAAQLETRTSTGCPMSRMYTSEDGGLHWSAVALPVALAGACAPSLLSINGTLALWTTRMPTPTGETRDARLWLSFDSGKTWRSAGAGLPGGRIESVVSARADGALLVLLRRTLAGASAVTDAPATSELWSCPAGCPNWREIAAVPGSAPDVVATSSGWLPAGGGWGPLYAEGTAPFDSGSVQALTTPVAGSPSVSAESNAVAWQAVPPSSWSAVESGVPTALAAPRPSRIVGVGPDGLLVRESRDAAVTIGTSAATQGQAIVSVLSVWDPGTRRWLAPVLVEPAAATTLAAVWDEQGANGALRLTIWLVTRSGGVLPIVVPNNEWQVSYPAPRCQRCG